MQNGVEIIAAERARQISEEGLTPEHDDQHTGGQLAQAATAYALPRSVQSQVREELFPWPDFWKPGTRLRDLAKAGALIAAEIERLLRLEGSDGETG